MRSYHQFLWAETDEVQSQPSSCHLQLVSNVKGRDSQSHQIFQGWRRNTSNIQTKPGWWGCTSFCLVISKTWAFPTLQLDEITGRCLSTVLGFSYNHSLKVKNHLFYKEIQQTWPQSKYVTCVIWKWKFVSLKTPALLLHHYGNSLVQDRPHQKHGTHCPGGTPALHREKQ